MTYKNRFLVLALCTFMGNVNASEAISTEEDSLEVISKAEMQELKQLLKIINSKEFIATVQIAADKMVESSQVMADAMIESSQVAAAAMAKTSKEFGVEAAKEWADKIKSASRPWELMLWALVFIYAAQSIHSVINY